ncbi:hypothetical protein ACMD2_17624 [Ananas comosus]|uniref:Leucine-rich repeat-containing N-terminal plant-type domain-containing protein n=1 Tax=Ananas comosus TaxID=4615 RepID=A0A199V247_ANACO|nr:hypothetical protein ACMD2_17624 [Ananas comosus]
MQSLRRLVLLSSLLLFLVLLSAPKSAWALEATILDPVDYLALQAIPKSLFDMPGGAFFQSWDFTSDPCAGFRGVQCSGGRVVALALGDPRAGSPGLYGRLPPALSALSALSSLSLVPGRVSGPIPPALPLLPSLRFLALSSNLLSGPLPRSFSPALRTLDLSSNRLSGPSPPPSSASPSSPPSANRFSGRVPGAVFTLPLASLRLQRNRFSGALRPDGPAPDGATVDLSYNRLTGRVPAELATAGTIYLNSNRFTGDVPAALVARVTAGAVRLLYLQHNYLTGFALAPNSSVPPGTSLCLHDNCMVPPAAAATSCPVRAGRRKTRPPAECAGNTSSYQR